MCLSMFLAKIVGLYLLLVSLSLLIHQQRFKKIITEFAADQPLLSIVGALGVIFGLLIVLSHNLWVWGWPVVITLFGWVTLLHGVGRLFFPDHCVKVVKHLAHKKGFLAWSWFWFLAGLYLVWVGFSA